MAGAVKRFDCGPVTFEVNAAVTGGQLVMPDGTTGKIKPATAGAATVLGVAETDGIPTTTDQNPSATNRIAQPISQYVAVASEGFYDLVYGGACAAGVRVKAGATGKVVAWVGGTDNADLIVGVCINAAAADGDKRLTKLSI